MKKFEFSEETQKYKQLQHLIMLEIASCKVPPGYALPSLNELKNLHGCDRNTVVKAYSVLKRAGFVDSTRGRYTVADGADNRAKAVIAGAWKRRLEEMRRESEYTGIELPKE